MPDTALCCDRAPKGDVLNGDARLLGDGLGERGGDDQPLTDARAALLAGGGNFDDGRGNFAMGVKEHIVFPEINYDKVDQVWGMDIIVCTTARTDDEARALLKAFNFPFRQ